VNYVLVFLMFLADKEPVIAAKSFTDLNTCQHTEGDALTSAFVDDTVVGWLIIDECKPVGGKATKG
jgi:hypothetical protein